VNNNNMTSRVLCAVVSDHEKIHWATSLFDLDFCWDFHWG